MNCEAEWSAIPATAWVLVGYVC